MCLEIVESASNILFKLCVRTANKRFFQNALLMKVASLNRGNAEINDLTPPQQCIFPSACSDHLSV
jgi:hypothetical protein